MSRLAEIIQKKSARVAASKDLMSGAAVEMIARWARETARPGIINGDADPAAVAQKYERGRAAAISVLTEEDFFSGSLDDLRAVRQQTSCPILRKDFIFDDYQVYESAAAGADALLLIVAALDDDRLRSLRKLTEDELAMDALVEVHTHDEMQRAINCGANIIGVNNRNLATFEVSLSTSIELAVVAPPAAKLISESGIESREDIDRLRDAGYHGFLIGETLMKAANPETLLMEFTELRGGARTSS